MKECHFHRAFGPFSGLSRASGEGFLARKGINRKPAVPHDGDRLFGRIISADALASGWERVRANGGAAGGDRISVEGFSLLSQQRLAALQHELTSGRYVPGPLRRVDIAKASGGVRTLAIPCVADRIVQSSAAQVLSPLLEAEFEDMSFGYRPGRSVRQALRAVQKLRDEGYRWTVDADIEAFFDSVPHDRLLARFEQSFGGQALPDLVALWLESAMHGGRGLAQGSPVSPLLANLYLDALDEDLLDEGLRVVRYADDFVILSKRREDAEQALEDARNSLARLGLVLHPGKTRVRSFDDALRYLGATFVRSLVITGSDDPDAGIGRLMREIAGRDRDADEAQAVAGQRQAADSAAGYDRGVRLLHVHGAGRVLGLANMSFTVRERPDRGTGTPGSLLAAIHPTRLDRIELGPDTDTNSDALRNALAFGLTVDFVNGHGQTQGTLAPPISQRGHRHLRQARHCLDPDLALALARLLVNARLRNQRALVRRINQRRKDGEVSRHAVAISRHVRLAARATTLDSLRGHEGEAAAHYWRAFDRLLLHGWRLASRDRPGTDPVNVVLNITASLLERDVHVLVERAGLHAGFGALHATSDGRDACVYDLMEVFRAPIAESAALDAFNTRMVRDEHFVPWSPEPGKKALRINAAGYGAVVRSFEERMETLVASQASDKRMTWRALIGEQARALASHVEDVAPFQPYLLDY
jgi:CRISPR-associated protein Cas1